VAAAPDRDRQVAALREPNRGPDVGYAGSPPSRNMNIANCAKPTLTKEPLYYKTDLDGDHSLSSKCRYVLYAIPSPSEISPKPPKRVPCGENPPSGCPEIGICVSVPLTHAGAGRLCASSAANDATSGAPSAAGSEANDYMGLTPFFACDSIRLA
jgi:hypothetical protein